MSTNTNARKAARLNPEFTAAALEMEGRDRLAAAVRAGDMTAEAAEAEARRERAAEAESEARAAEAVRTREAADHAAETAEAARRAAAKLTRTREDAARRLTRPETAEDAADLDRLARDIETAEAVARAAAETAEARRAEYIAARAALRAADLAALNRADPLALLNLAAAAMHKAIDRRERDTAESGAALRARYARRVNAETAGETLDLDGVQETAADILAAVLPGGWIDGDPVAILDRETGEAVDTPRAAVPLVYLAAVMAGRALDRLKYADGGRAVKLTGRELREHYRKAAERAAALRAEAEAAGRETPDHVADLAALHDLAEAADLLAVEASESHDPETVKAAKAAREDYYREARRLASGAAVTETRRTAGPIAPGPEAAAIRAERVARVLAETAPALRGNAAKMARAVYEGAETLREAAEAAHLNRETGRRAWEALRAAAGVVLAEDGETAAAARLRESDRRTRETMGHRRTAAAVAHEADRLAEAVADHGDPIPEAVALWEDVARRTRPERLAATAKLTPADLAAVAALARAFYRAEAER